MYVVCSETGRIESHGFVDVFWWVEILRVEIGSILSAKP
jgi:hypothetical protein